MNEQIAQKVLQKGRDFGADIVEIFEEETRYVRELVKENVYETAKAGINFGVGVRCPHPPPPGS